MSAEIRSIELTDEVRQDASKDPSEEESAAAYLVFDVDGEDHLFGYFDKAQSFAERQMERSNAQRWDVYPLYASEPIEIA